MENWKCLDLDTNLLSFFTDTITTRTSSLRLEASGMSTGLCAICRVCWVTPPKRSTLWSTSDPSWGHIERRSSRTGADTTPHQFSPVTASKIEQFLHRMQSIAPYKPRAYPSWNGTKRSQVNGDQLATVQRDLWDLCTLLRKSWGQILSPLQWSGDQMIPTKTWRWLKCIGTIPDGCVDVKFKQ